MESKKEHQEFSAYEYHESKLKDIISRFFGDISVQTSGKALNELLDDHLSNKEFDLKKEHVQEMVTTINTISLFISSLNEKHLILKLLEIEQNGIV